MSMVRDVVKELGSSPHFLGIPAPVLHAISTQCEPVSWRKDAVVVERGSTIENLVLVSSGFVEVLRQGPDGQARVTSKLGPGMFVGVSELVDHAPSAATYRAGAAATGLVFTAAGARRLLGDRRPPGAAFRRALTLSLSGQLLAANDFLRRILGHSESAGDEEFSLVSGLLDGG